MAYKSKGSCVAKEERAVARKNVSLKIGKHKSRTGGLTKAGREKYNRERVPISRLLSLEVVLVSSPSVLECLVSKDR